jgi:hypothetical protein
VFRVLHSTGCLDPNPVAVGRGSTVGHDRHGSVTSAKDGHLLVSTTASSLPCPLRRGKAGSGHQQRLVERVTPVCGLVSLGLGGYHHPYGKLDQAEDKPQRIRDGDLKLARRVRASVEVLPQAFRRAYVASGKPIAEPPHDSVL